MTAGAGQQANLLFLSLSRTTLATVLFSGAGLGSAAGANVGTITFTTIPTFNGAGLTGTINKGILPYALIKNTTTNTIGFATTDSSGIFSLRPLSASEQVATLNATTGANLSLASSGTDYGSLLSTRSIWRAGAVLR